MPSPVTAVSEHHKALSTLAARIERHDGPRLQPLLQARGYGPYRGYHELLAEIHTWADRSDGPRLTIAGRSVRGEPIIGVQLGNPDPSPSTRTSVIVSGLHPIEWVGIECAFSLFRKLLATDLGNRSVIMFPIANPDGVLKVERHLRRQRRRFVRHNARGVDLNRNFDAHWGHKNVLAKLVPWVFKPGSYAASEPETSSLAYALGQRRVDRSLSMHSFGGVVLYPSSHSVWPVADRQEHRRWAEAIGRAADDKPYRALPSSWFGLGMTMGGLELDWFHERHGALSLLVECSRGGFGLDSALQWRRWLDPFAWFNPRELAQTSERIAEASLSFVRGDRTPA